MLTKGRNLVRVFLALLLLSAQARAAEKISKETLESQGRKRTYYLFVPGSVSAAAPAPLVVLLHGSGRDGLSLAEKWKELAAAEGFIIAGPDASGAQGWRTPEDGPEFIRDLVEALRAKYPVNPRRVYLFGHSAGAVFAINLSMMESEYFAATAVHAGSWREEDEFSLADYAKRRTPLAIFVGDRDPFFPLSSVRATEAALKGRGFTVEVTVMKGHDHWYYDLAPEINRNAWAFLKRYELNAEPAYAAYEYTGEAGDVNAAVKEINALRMKFNDSLQLFNAREAELRAKGEGGEAAAAIARAQVGLLKDGAAALSAAALRAEQASRLKLKGGYAQYFSLLAQAARKRVEALDAMRERLELSLSHDPPDAVTARMNEATVRAERLNREADELEQNAERARVGRHQ
ncbi:MAG: alpha/beta fold hydrolase [Acidobacteriota bacterium]|nr:alpha/beta fold hydrolase [Acidobacteriota bacterium]